MKPRHSPPDGRGQYAAVSETCEHGELVFAARADATTPAVEGGQPSFLLTRVAVRCGRCYVQFHWCGLGTGVPNPDEAVVSADGYELRVAIAPGPGGVVKLLEAVGMTDKLINPEEGPHGE